MTSAVFFRDLRWAGAQPRLKSWGGPRLGSQHRGACRAGCWVQEGVAKTQMLNPAFWWLLAVKFLAFWKLRPRSWGNQYIVCPQPKSWGPVSPGPCGCCVYMALSCRSEAAAMSRLRKLVLTCTPAVVAAGRASDRQVYIHNANDHLHCDCMWRPRYARRGSTTILYARPSGVPV